MGALEEIAKLKAARRAEIAEQEAERERAVEQAHRDSLARLDAVVRDTLIGQVASWLSPYRSDSHTPDLMPQLRRAITVHFDVPGHRRIGLDFQHVEIARGEWVPLHDDDGEWTRWYAINDRSHPELRLSLADALIVAEIEGWTPPAQPEAERVLSPEAERAAATAWLCMLQAEEPMPPGIALDMVQDVADGNRDDAVTALHHAAANWLDTLRPEQAVKDGESTPDMIVTNSVCFNNAVALRGYLLGEGYNLADNCRLEIHNTCLDVQQTWDEEHGYEEDSACIYTGEDVSRAHAWRVWCEDAVKAIDLCRAVAAAAHPEPASST